MNLAQYLIYSSSKEMHEEVMTFMDQNNLALIYKVSIKILVCYMTGTSSVATAIAFWILIIYIKS
jgi:hypothetical protein